MSIDFTKKYILENDFVILRPLEMLDKTVLKKYAVNEPEIWKYNINGGNGEENFERYFNNAMQQFEEKKDYPFIVFDKKSNQYAGMTRFYDISNEFKRLDIGFTWYGKAFQGTGLNKNCKYLLLELAFDNLRMIRVGFAANSKNERSINAMKSIGCKEEGVLRNYSKDADGNIIDAIKLSILKEEWDEDVKFNLRKKIQNL
ncbi:MULTISPECIES: GNAT family N-acetyltransferase [Flavobacterium]|uniref:GNAT family N-acetyltransferase n=2 Tax=Flavobacterium TaxID=237 RepID=A0A246GJI4_9FLAO|nr:MULTISPECIES: GNAT family N-acetyltransferase [Flavobacterium]OWP84272.1 GNAT family N-acetyltransferase [Flavobacterium davisii]QYS89840.1 GNAT family N-acetyltransferase [Flavobacterium davisii]SPE76968.1 Putative ribosomal N-acetyltransferase YdaF [Flavobacterium columnare]